MSQADEVVGSSLPDSGRDNPQVAAWMGLNVNLQELQGMANYWSARNLRPVGIGSLLAALYFFGVCIVKIAIQMGLNVYFVEFNLKVISWLDQIHVQLGNGLAEFLVIVLVFMLYVVPFDIVMALGISELFTNLYLIASIVFVLTAEGIWLICTPSPFGRIVHGIIKIIFSAWFIYAPISAVLIAVRMAKLDLIYFSPESVVGMVLFLIIVFMVNFRIAFGLLKGGFRNFRWYRRFSKMPQIKPSADTSRRFAEMVKYIKKTRIRRAHDLIEIIVTRPRRFWFRRWRGKLAGDSAVFVEICGLNRFLLFAQKEDVVITVKGGVGRLRAAFDIAGQRGAGYISFESLQRYEEWKGQ